MSESPYIFDVTAENFQQIVLDGSSQVPVLVDFWASWCQPCQMLMPVLAQLAEEYQGKFILAKVNTEEQQDIAMQFGIRSIPTVKLFKEGTEVDEFAGALPPEQIRAFLDKHLPRETDGVAASAQQLLATGDADGALALLAPAQAQDPNNWNLAILMAQANMAKTDYETAGFILDALPPEEQNKAEVSLLRGQLYFSQAAPAAEEINPLMERFNTDPKDSEAQYKLSIYQVLQQDYPNAVNSLLNLMMRDRDYGDDAAREALLKLFDMLGDDPIATAGRRKMFNLMH
jgi:putative thioredoxin